MHRPSAGCLLTKCCTVLLLVFVVHHEALGSGAQSSRFDFDHLAVLQQQRLQLSQSVASSKVLVIRVAVGLGFPDKKYAIWV